MEVRLIDGSELYNIEKLLDTDIIRNSKEASFLMSQVLYDIQAQPTIDPETLPIVQELRKENDELKRRIVFWNRDMIAQLTNENQELKQQLSRMAEERDSLKIYYNDLSSKPDCNTCKKQNCKYKPGIGKTVRVNCPLWEGQR